MVIIYRRNWSQWFRMHWVVNVSVNISEKETKIFRTPSSRWYILALFHMLYLESKIKNEYTFCNINSWLDWEV
jgi:hypothetical protein